MINENDIKLVVFQDGDVALFEKWINKDYIYKWFCNDGGESEKEAWLEEVKNREENSHRHQYIVTYKGIKIGYCVCIDLFGEVEYTEECYSDLIGKIVAKEVLEIGYCIGEDDYLNKGIGKIIIKKLEEQAMKLGAVLLLADPNEKNISSIKVLLTNGFYKYKAGDYRKQLR